MSPSNFYQLLIQNFPFEPTENQAIFLQKMALFTLKDNANELFVLKGFAGTGKTTVISTLVNQLPKINKKAVLLAPTGRAAKVIGNYSNQTAFTIHKRIYFPKKSKSGGLTFTLQANKFKDTIFICDEASMISDAGSENSQYENGSLLDDLLFYVEAGNNCKLILVGDTAQLPPVKSDISPALDTHTLSLNYNKDILHIELNEVMRQAVNSGILHNATLLREQLKSHFLDDFKFEKKRFKDIIRLEDGYEIEDAINSSYSNFGTEDTSIIVRSNKRANQYNQQIRTRILGKESDLATGDLLMVVKNNYFWLDEKSEAGFIANGDIVEILSIRKIQELYGFNFATVSVRMIDYENEKPFDTIVILDILVSETPALTYDESSKLYQEVSKDYANETVAYKRLQKVKENPYFNALQVKFAYAFTCHKSQGGQWHTVFVEKPYLPNGIDVDYIRWLYTAITRAKNQLYLIGFKDEDFE
jgi:ATP-dependent exoDNAse (exonuclease V) alpha subunit